VIAAHPQTEGAGLGLSISADLVTIMGGTIGASSLGPNKGSQVWFTMPVVPPPDCKVHFLVMSCRLCLPTTIFIMIIVTFVIFIVIIMNSFMVIFMLIIARDNEGYVGLSRGP
jgi:hypothetical protein